MSNNNMPVKNGVAKVPVVMQMEALECGAASLTMVMAYYGKWVALEQVREDCGVSRDGAKAGNIARVARTYGFNAKGYSFSINKLKEKAVFPCIVHWNFNHFIVLKGFKKGKVYINDPARGSIVISEKEFDEGFTGICIMFSPGEGFEPSGRQNSMLAFAKKRLTGTGSAIAFVVVTTCIATIATIINAGFSRFFMDNLLVGDNSGLIAVSFIFFTIITLCLIISEWLKAIYSLRINGKFAAVSNATYLWHVLNLPMSFFSQRLAGDIEQRRRSNAVIASTLVNTFAPLVINTGMLVFYSCIMLGYSIPMTLVGLSSILINILVARHMSAQKVNITRVMMRDEAKLMSATVSGIEMIETIKSSGSENGFFGRWSGYQASVSAQKVHIAEHEAYIGKVPEIVIAVVNNIILAMGVYLVIKGEFTSGMVLAFQGILTQFLAPAHSFIEAGQLLQEMRTQMERIDDVMEYPEDNIFNTESSGINKGEVTLDKLKGELTLKNVTFGYSKLSPPLIEDFNLTLRQGKSVAFVGGTGCGKSTLSKLISGLYKPWGGEIMYDGKTIGEIDNDVFTGSVAVVDQDIILFEDTIANNIKMWDNSIEDFEMILAARDAHIHEDIMQRQGGYNYKLTEGGRDLSGGQRQRLEIARVLAEDPTLIIMDEATSALDAQTEYEVVRSIRNRGITCIVIAHRLSTIRDCDEIIVLDKGKVVERGTHEELMANDGMYKALVTNE